MSNKNISGDLSLVKRLNKLAIISIIKDSGSISRADIAKQTKLNKATVSTIVDELLQIELIKEIGAGQSSGGRRPILVVLNDNAGSIIGIDLQISHISILLTNLNAKTIWEKKVLFIVGKPIVEILAQLEELINEAVELAPKTPLGILGVGMGIPGIVDQHKGEVLIAPNLGWHNIPIKKHFEERFDFPIFIDNEANAAALAEKMYGNGKNVDNLVYISAGTGIGVGLILNGEQYHGTQGYSGEFGHMTIERNGLKCPCGNQGCWEMYASEKSFMNSMNQEGEFNNKSFSDFMGEDLINNHAVMVHLNEVGINLGIGITNIINAFNPDVVIIGNSLAQAGDLILKPIINTVHNRIINYFEQNVKITLTALGDKPRALGAATMVLSHLFENHSTDFFNIDSLTR